MRVGAGERMSSSRRSRLSTVSMTEFNPFQNVHVAGVQMGLGGISMFGEEWEATERCLKQTVRQSI